MFMFSLTAFFICCKIIVQTKYNSYKFENKARTFLLGNRKMPNYE